MIPAYREAPLRKCPGCGRPLYDAGGKLRCPGCGLSPNECRGCRRVDEGLQEFAFTDDEEFLEFEPEGVT